jgi:hypothetical protein
MVNHISTPPLPTSEWYHLSTSSIHLFFIQGDSSLSSGDSDIGVDDDEDIIDDDDIDDINNAESGSQDGESLNDSDDNF